MGMVEHLTVHAFLRRIKVEGQVVARIVRDEQPLDAPKDRLDWSFDRVGLPVIAPRSRVVPSCLPIAIFLPLLEHHCPILHNQHLALYVQKLVDAEL